jgi:hypothetical protein
MEKEIINLSIGKQNVIKIDNDDDDEVTCGRVEEKPMPVKQKVIPDKTICYKCKLNKSNFLNRSEYICRSYLLK